MTVLTLRNPDDGSYTLIVDGVPLIEREAFAVIDRVATCLLDPLAFPTSEAREVADQIREAHQQTDLFRHDAPLDADD